MTFIKDYRKEITLGAFAIVAILAIVLLTAVFKVPVVPVCIAIVLEVAIAVLLHNAELWIHGVVLLIELITGIIVGKIVIMLFCMLVYVAATATLKFIKE